VAFSITSCQLKFDFCEIRNRQSNNANKIPLIVCLLIILLIKLASVIKTKSSAAGIKTSTPKALTITPPEKNGALYF
jgi:hypothetical protein